MHPRTGILLPTDLLTNRFFLTFSLFVAFNTLIYLGLTAAKFIPWPTQIRPSQVRAMLPAMSAKELVMRETPARVQPSGADPYGFARDFAATQNIPRAFALGGALIIAVTIANTTVGEDGPVTRIISIAFGVVSLALALVLPRLKASAAVMSWAWTLMFAGFVLNLAVNAYLVDSAVGLTYAAVTLVLVPPVAMNWAPAIVGGIIGLAATATAGVLAEQINSLPWIIASISAFIAGMILLQLRINLVDSITEEQLRARALETTDPLTGLLGRVGLLSLTPSLIDLATHDQSPVHVISCRVGDLARENSDYGWAYGDAILSAVARAVRVAVPHDDLVGRWSSVTFLAIGLGEPQARAALRTRITQAVEDSGLTLGKRPITLEIGSATGPASEAVVEDLVERARASARSGDPVEEPR